MRTLLTFALVTSVICIALVAWAQQTDAPASAADQRKGLQELLTQRRDTLQRLLEVRSEQFKSGRGSYRDVQEAVNELIDAKLQLATDRTERIKLLREHVDTLRKFEEATQSSVKVGQSTQAEVLIAEAARLKAEIRLVQEESSNN